MSKIVLNWLPPADTNSPSFCLSILKSFMKRHGFDVKIIYWNLLFEGIPGIDEIPYAAIFPFFIEMNYRRGYSQSRIEAILKSVNPNEYADLGSFHSLVDRIHENLNGIIDSVLQTYANQKILLWGFSSKYYQWIPATIIAESIKCLLPGAKIALGGMGTRNEAEVLLRLFRAFDFGIWGEGEFPLQKLCHELSHGQEKFHTIPNLTFNDNGNVQSTDSQSSEFADLNQSAIPDYEDYNIQAKDKLSDNNTYLPVESSRGCHWNRCKFCFLNDGYKYRVKEHRKLLEEIDQLKALYGTNNYAFVDPDLVGADIGRFRSIVKTLLDYNKKNQYAVCFKIAEINPGQVNEETIKMMSRAGFKHLQIGFEAISDSLLRKMNKKTTVAKNLYFIKHALRNRLYVQGANIISGIPDETTDDVVESTDNLHYLRFFLDHDRFSIQFSPFALKSTSIYFKQLSEEEKSSWCNNLLYDVFPLSKKMEGEKYDLFDFIGDKNRDWWMLFQKRLTYYLENSFSYKVTYDNDVCLFEEYVNNRLKRSLKLSHISTDLLKLLEQKVCSLTDIYKYFRVNNAGVSEKDLKRTIIELKNEYLVYANERLSEITSIISVQRE